MAKQKNNEKYIFSDDNIADVAYILDSKIDSLRNIKKYRNYEKEVFDLSDKIEKNLPDDLKKDFERLFYVTGELESYSNALLYSLGIKYGIETKNL